MRGPDVGRSWLKVALGCSVSSWMADGGGRGRVAKPARWLTEYSVVGERKRGWSAVTLGLNGYATKSRNNNNSCDPRGCSDSERD